MANPKLAKRIYRLQNRIVRELNNAHIFLEQARTPLLDVKAKYETSKSKEDRKYYVPSIGKSKFAKRTDAELKDIYAHYVYVGLFEAFLVNSLSRFESFLADVLLEFFLQYPNKLTERVQGVPACPEVSPKQIIEASDKDQLLNGLIREHLSNVFRQRPSVYMAYISRIVGVDKDPSFLDYYEIAATRDLVVHNSRIANQLYLEKARTRARGKLGTELPVDKNYYYDALAKMKKVAGVVKRDVEKTFGAETRSNNRLQATRMKSRA